MKNEAYRKRLIDEKVAEYLNAFGAGCCDPWPAAKVQRQQIVR